MPRASLASLRVRLLLLVLFAVLPAAALILYTGWEQRRQAAVDVQENALRLARLASTVHERLIEGAHQLLLALAQLPGVRAGEGAACSALFADLLKQYPRYANLGVAGYDGKVFCSALPVSSPITIADRPYFRRALETRTFAVGEYQIGRITRKASLNFGQPVLDATGRVQAVVVAALDLAWLNQLAAESKLPPGSTTTVIDRTGMILGRHPESDKWVGQIVPKGTIADLVLTQQEGVGEVPDIDGTPTLIAFTPLGGGDTGRVCVREHRHPEGGRICRSGPDPGAQPRRIGARRGLGGRCGLGGKHPVASPPRERAAQGDGATADWRSQRARRAAAGPGRTEAVSPDL